MTDALGAARRPTFAGLINPILGFMTHLDPNLASPRTFVFLRLPASRKRSSSSGWQKQQHSHLQERMQLRGPSTWMKTSQAHYSKMN